MNQSLWHDRQLEADALRVLVLSGTQVDKAPTYSLRVQLMLPELARRGIQVETRFLPRDPGQRREFLRRLPAADLIWLHRLSFWPSELRRLRAACPTMVLDIDDPIGFSSSAHFQFSARKLFKFAVTARASAAVLAATEGLVAHARPWNRQVHLVRLCADPARHRMHVAPRGVGEPLRLLWLGGKSTFKYLNAVRPHLEAIGRRRPDVELTVVGHQELTLDGLRVVNRHWSEAAEREALAAAHVGLAPLADDRWTRHKGTLKPLQYLANGMPFLGPPVGHNVWLSQGGACGLLAVAPCEWADAVERLADDEPLRRSMGSKGVELVRGHHSPDGLAAQIADIFYGLMVPQS